MNGLRLKGRQWNAAGMEQNDECAGQTQGKDRGGTSTLNDVAASAR
jgi:hypothetical protein